MTHKKSVAIVDFGTSNVRVNIVDVDNGKVMYSCLESYKMVSSKSGYTELNVEDLWSGACRCFASVMQEVRRDKQCEVSAVNFSYFGDCVILCDENREPLYNLILAFDPRGEREAEEINGYFGEKRIIATTGSAYTWISSPAKLLWFKRNMPDLFSKVKHIFTNQQFILHKLGLEPVNDKTMGGRKSMMNILTYRWDEEIADYIGITTGLLGDVVESDTVVGCIEKFGDTDLGRKTPVLVGAHDCNCGLLGLGITTSTDDRVGNISGTFDHYGYFIKEYSNVKEDTQDYFLPISSVTGCMKGSTVVLGAMPSYGALVNWYMRQIYGLSAPKDHDYDTLWNSVRFDSTNSMFVCPQYNTERGIIYGLGLTKTREDIFEAIIEALTFESKKLFLACQQQKSEKIKAVRIGGGPSKSDVWNTLRATVMNVRFERMQNMEVSSLGSAVIAAVSTGIYSGYDEAIKNMARVGKCFEPDLSLAESYRKKFEAYTDFYRKCISMRRNKAT
ncbi:MAG: FGGY-family carbohydrate kinase [Christensenellales bacterium]|jgi:xylulokinase